MGSRSLLSGVNGLVDADSCSNDDGDSESVDGEIAMKRAHRFATYNRCVGIYPLGMSTGAILQALLRSGIQNLGCSPSRQNRRQIEGDEADAH